MNVSVVFKRLYKVIILCLLILNLLILKVIVDTVVKPILHSIYNHSYKIFHGEKRIHIYYDMLIVDQTTVVLINATHITYIIHVIQYKVKKYCRKSRAKTAFIECK